MTDRRRRRDRALGAEAPGTPGDATRRRRPIAFALHQFFEYLVAIFLVVMSVHIGRSNLLLAGGSALGALAVTARGPLGLVRLCGRRLHAFLDVAVAVLLAAAPLVPAFRPGVAGTVAVEIVGLAWLRLAWLTRYTAPTAPVAPVAAPVVAPVVAPVAPVPADGPAFSAIRGLGRLAAGAQDRLPDAQATLEAGARRAGAQAGRLQRAWRRAAR